MLRGIDVDDGGEEECLTVVALLLEVASRIMEDDEVEDEDAAGGNEDVDDVELMVAGIEGTLVALMTLVLAERFTLTSSRLGLRRFEHQIRTVVSSEALASM